MLIPIGFFGGAVDTGAFDLLATSVLTSTATSVTFDVSTYAALGYKHLQIRAVARDNRAGNVSNPYITLNGDTGSNYTYHWIIANGSTISSGGNSTNTGYIGAYAGGNAGTNIFGPFIIDLLDIFSTTKNKTFKALGGVNGAGNNISMWSASRMNTAAATSVTINADPGSSFVTGSRFSLYGIKG